MRTLITLAALTTFILGAAPRHLADGAGEKLQSGSIWKGSVSADERKARGKSFAATLKVTSRDGRNFEATFTEIVKKPRTLDIKGEITDGGNVKMQPTAIENGAWEAHTLDKVWIGTIDGSRLTFKIVGADHVNDNAQGQQVDLTLK